MMFLDLPLAEPGPQGAAVAHGPGDHSLPAISGRYGRGADHSVPTGGDETCGRPPVSRGTVAMPAVRGKQPAYVDMAGVHLVLQG